MRPGARFLALVFTLFAASASYPALAQATHEIKGKIVQVEASQKRIVVEETRGRKYKQPLGVGDASKIELTSGAGSLAQIHVGDEVVVSYAAGATGPEVVELKVTRAAGS
jgi:hypothetical protein